MRTTIVRFAWILRQIQYWPFVIAHVGVGRIIDARSVGRATKGGFLIFLAFWIYANP
nr:hypothetical protein [Rhodoferax sp.]